MFIFFFITEPALIAKSSLLLDVKPWDDETDMVALEKSVRSIEADGLLWGACKWLFYASCVIKIFSSPELKAQGSFSDHLLSVVIKNS